MQGLADFLKVVQTARKFEVDVRRVLDFGSATGRVTRHFCTQLDDVEVWASDINPDHIDWLRRFMPQNLKPVLASELPGLPIADDCLDIICAFSVFTHINTSEIGWLAELSRVLRPGGICYFSVHNEDTWQALAELDASNRLIQSMINCGEVSLDDLQKPMPEDRMTFEFLESGPYRWQVFHSNKYLKRVWGQFFDILEIRPRTHHRQSVVVMTKSSVRKTDPVW